jgi:tetratricopeptide (TPR) repeat protein
MRAGLVRSSLLLGVLSCACAGTQAELPEGAEARSLLGAVLVAPPLTAEGRATRQAQLEEAERRAAADPASEEARIWVGRRLAYLGRFRDAIAVYTKALEQHPGSARLLRHRGHRWITVREFGRAIADLSRAAELIAGKPDEIEPDGQPNARNQPTGTLGFNVWYHLGLARFLAGDFPAAVQGFSTCLRSFGQSPDKRVAASHWLWMALMREGREREAVALFDGMPPDLDVFENRAYYQLCLLYAGQRTAAELMAAAETGGDNEFATIGFGVANWHLQRAGRARGTELLRRVVERGPWPSFGCIAAEAELLRLTAP